jgi:mannose-6-phosphate isomerase-like protein (cupin superfamily)
MTTTEAATTHRTISIEEVALTKGDGERQYVRLRSDLGIGAFGASAIRAAAAGSQVIGEHDELGPGADRHEELYLVLNGHALFTVAGEEVDAPQGTAVFVGDPEAKRGAVAKEDGTIVVAVGAPRDKAFRITPGEAMRDFFDPYNAKDYEGALAIARGVLHEYPGNGLALYNIACMEALLGRTEDSLGHLKEALGTAPRLIEYAKTDDDFASLRGEKRFEGLLAN